MHTHASDERGLRGITDRDECPRIRAARSDDRIDGAALPIERFDPHRFLDRRQAHLDDRRGDASHALEQRGRDELGVRCAKIGPAATTTIRRRRGIMRGF
jgi:hypothetical protein